VPTLKDIGLWGPRIRNALTEMGIMELAQVDIEELCKSDEDVAAEFDRMRAMRAAYVDKTIAMAASET